jgi:DNA-binding GntR family transcriptional regulator
MTSSNGPDKQGRSEAIALAIRAAVIEQRLAPGAKLSEDEIGAAFGVSRTIVRAALITLAKEGVVVTIPNRGAFVGSPDVQEALQVFQARRVIELALVREAAQRCTAEAAARLTAHLDAESDALARGDRPAAIRLSGDFHLEIARISGQQVLAPFLAGLISRTALVIALYGRSRVSACGNQEHRALAEALARHDGEEAARLMEHHLAHIEADLDLAPPLRPPPDLRSALTGAAPPFAPR